MKVNSMLAVACTALVITSCSNEEIVPVSMSKKVSVVLNLPAMAHTRAIDNIANSGDMVTMSGTVKLYAKTAQDGGVVNTLTLQVSDFTGLDTGTGSKTVEISGAATYIEVGGNIDGSATKTDDVNSRQGGVTSDAVRVVGGAAIVTGGSTSTCSIEVAPEMARVEVKGDLGSSFTNLAELKVKGIYLNNVKQKRADAAVVKTTKASAPDWTTAYTAGGTKSNLYNTFIGTPITKFDSGKADGYNFFPQDFHIASLSAAATTKEEAAKYHPHVIMEVEYKMNGVGALSKTGWLNVVALKDNTSSSYIGEFANGKVYQLDLADIKKIMDVPVPPVTVDPDPDAVNVDVTVTVKGWELVFIKPEV